MNDEMDHGKAVLALRKSSVRREVLNYLVSVHPLSSYPAEISRKIDRGINDVYGALNGVSNRYKKEYSLIALGLVKGEKQGNVTYYVATDLGCRSCR